MSRVDPQEAAELCQLLDQFLATSGHNSGTCIVALCAVLARGAHQTEQLSEAALLKMVAEAYQRSRERLARRERGGEPVH